MKFLKINFMIIIALTILFQFDCFAQPTFQKTYGGSGNDEFNCIQSTYDGGFIAVGSTTSFGAVGEDVYLVKLDQQGNIEWSETFNNSSLDVGNYVQQTADSGFIVLGYTRVSNEENYLIKTDKNGKLEWSKTLGSGYGYGGSVQQTGDGGYIISSRAVTSFGPWKYYLIKTNNKSLWWDGN